VARLQIIIRRGLARGGTGDSSAAQSRADKGRHLQGVGGDRPEHEKFLVAQEEIRDEVAALDNELPYENEDIDRWTQELDQWAEATYAKMRSTS
jgi:hypothetical protein